jgi:manganese transport protein
LELVAISLIALVGGCFAVELLLLQPDWSAVIQGFWPRGINPRQGNELFLAAGILGATVMPHNLYLHSSLVQSRRWPIDPMARHWALRYSTWDAVLALSLAFLINCSILILAAGSFHGQQLQPVADLHEAYRLLTPTLGTALASTLFAVALLAAGQSSSLTATLAGQIVMDGFLQIRLPDWQRRLLTRCLALVPALGTVLLLGESAINQLLILSQVVLSLQLPFAVIPLILFCSRPGLMGNLLAPPWLVILSWSCAALIVAINASLLLSLVF